LDTNTQIQERLSEAGAAYLYSLAAAFAPALFPRVMPRDGGIIDAYYEAAAVMTALVLRGQVLEWTSPGLGDRSKLHCQALSKASGLTPPRWP
jgi:cation transport ATPase